MLEFAKEVLEHPERVAALEAKSTVTDPFEGSWLESGAALCSVLCLVASSCRLGQYLALGMLCMLLFWSSTRQMIWSGLNQVLVHIGVQHPETSLLWLGVQRAGKTTLLCELNADPSANDNPFSGAFQLGRLPFRFYDINQGSGIAQRRIIWNYFGHVDGVIYMVDASNPECFGEAEQEIWEFLNEPGLYKVPFAVLGNKADVATSVSEMVLRERLHLWPEVTSGRDSRKSGQTAGSGRAVEVFMCSALQRTGYQEAFNWLVANRHRPLNTALPR